jgi:hypothetical protein
MEKRWYARMHSMLDTIVVKLSEGEPFAGIRHFPDRFSQTTRLIEDTLNRELPRGQKRRHDIRKEAK